MARRIFDIQLPEDSPKDLLLNKHVEFLQKYAAKHAQQSELGFLHALDFLRLSGVYWCLTGLHIAKSPLKESEINKVVNFVKSCYHQDCGGFSPAPDHDPHVLATLSAVQVLVLVDKLDELDKDAVATYIKSLQLPDGSFQGDQWGEIDTRFSFCAAATVALIDRLHVIDKQAAVDYIMRCWNGIDGGFGTRPGSESHAGQMYCCIGALSIFNSLRAIPDVDLTAWWLAERQLPSGGLNGRPEKAPDVCYSWWILSCLRILDRIHWIDSSSLQSFIFASQDGEEGGIADRPGDMADPFHTMLGLAGLSLLGSDQLQHINPVFCLPQQVIENLAIPDIQLFA